MLNRKKETISSALFTKLLFQMGAQPISERIRTAHADGGVLYRKCAVKLHAAYLHYVTSTLTSSTENEHGQIACFSRTQ